MNHLIITFLVVFWRAMIIDSKTLQQLTEESLEGCNCSRSEIDPVCANNGVVFNNACEFQCARKHLNEMTLGGDADCCRRCPMRSTLVLGNNGVVYANTCIFDCARRRHYNLQQCLEHRKGGDEEDCECGKVLSPSCGTDGNIYNSPCVFECYQNARCNGTRQVQMLPYLHCKH